MIMELSPSEYMAVMKARAEAEAKASERAYRFRVLAVAGSFSGWLEQENAQPTFSTFVDEFGYQGADASYMFTMFSRLWMTAYPEQEEITKAYSEVAP